MLAAGDCWEATQAALPGGRLQPVPVREIEPISSVTGSGKELLSRRLALSCPNVVGDIGTIGSGFYAQRSTDHGAGTLTSAKRVKTVNRAERDRTDRARVAAAAVLKAAPGKPVRVSFTAIARHLGAADRTKSRQ